MIERTSAAGQAMRRPLLVPLIAVSQFAPPFMVSGVAVALPALGADLGAGATSLGLVESLFLAGSVAFLLPAGRLADAGGTLARIQSTISCVEAPGVKILATPARVSAGRSSSGMMPPPKTT